MRRLAPSVEAVAGLFALRSASAEAHESAARQSPALVEGLGRIHRDTAPPFESLGAAIAVTHAVEAALEWLSAAARTETAQVESLTQARAERQPPAEARQQALRTVLVAFAAEQRAAQLASPLIEALAGIRREGVIGLEALGQAVAVTRAVELAIESLGSIAGAAAVDAEAVQGFRAESAPGVEALAGVSRDATIPAAALASLVRSAAVAAETMAGASVTRTAAAEALGRALRELAVQLEADGKFPVPPLLARLVLAAADAARVVATDGGKNLMLEASATPRTLIARPPDGPIGG